MPDDEFPDDKNVVDFQKKKLETSRSDGGGRGRRTRNATGDNDNRGKGPFRAGEKLVCKVIQAEPGGYAVSIKKGNFHGFLPSDELLKPGEEVAAQYVCTHNGRLLLSGRLSAAQLLKTRVSVPDMDQERINARRAVDLIPPPDNADRFLSCVKDMDIEAMKLSIESNRKTMCLKTESDVTNSRAAAILFRGRVVGCIHGSYRNPKPVPVKEALEAMLLDLQEPSTAVEVYDLADEVVVSMSTLFLGYSIDRGDSLDARPYFDYISSWLRQNAVTACIAINLSNATTCLVFMPDGCYHSFYCLDSSIGFSKKLSELLKILDADPNARMEASIHERYTDPNSPDFGYKL
jgi:hypothetical protein